MRQAALVRPLVLAPGDAVDRGGGVPGADAVDLRNRHGAEPIAAGYTPFDGQSIMVYTIPKNHTTDGFEVKWGYELSPRDKQFIAAVYPQEVKHG